MPKKYNNSYIHIPRIEPEQRLALICLFPELMKCVKRHDPILVLEAMMYLIRSGCQWRLLPPCYPHWKSVYNKWRYWNATGLFDKIHSVLLRHARIKAGRNESPTLGFIDSASRRSGLSDSAKGIDGFKKIKGIKRHIVVDSQGNILCVHTTCANVNDGKAGLEVIPCVKLKYPSLREIRADKGYRGHDVADMAEENGIALACTKSNGGGQVFVPAQGRWVAERTFSWLDNYRRLVRNYERSCERATDMTVTAEIHRLMRFL